MIAPLTARQLAAAVPRSHRIKDAAAVLAGLNDVIATTKLETTRGVAALLAQLGHESASFRYLEELADGLAYEPHTRIGKRLGNTHPGDGPRYKGRGWIQLTGRRNYSLAGAALGLPLEAQPELAATIENAARVAAWYWNTNGCTPLADAGHFEALTRRINGGTNGLEDRIERYKRALGALERTTT